MVGQDRHQLILVLGLEQGIDGARRKLGEGVVCGGEDGERPRSLQRLHEAGGLQRGGEGLEIAGGHGGIDDVGFGSPSSAFRQTGGGKDDSGGCEPGETGCHGWSSLGCFRHRFRCPRFHSRIIDFNARHICVTCKAIYNDGIKSARGLNPTENRRAMVPETLAQGLEQYRIGEKVRALRKEKKLGLVQLAGHTGLSPGLLSKIERGRSCRPCRRCCGSPWSSASGSSISSSEAEPPAAAVIRKADRLRLPDRPDAATPSYFFESLDFPVTGRRMEAFLAEFTGAGVRRPPPHQHDGRRVRLRPVGPAGDRGGRSGR